MSEIEDCCIKGGEDSGFESTLPYLWIGDSSTLDNGVEDSGFTNTFSYYLIGDSSKLSSMSIEILWICLDAYGIGRDSS